MELPDHYKNLDINQKRVIVANLISQIGNENMQGDIAGFTDEQIDFLFTYFFTESKEEREKMWYNMKEKYQTSIKNLKVLAEKLQKLDFKFAELLAQREDAENFRKNIR